MKRRMNAIIAFLTILLALTIGAQADIQVPSVINGSTTVPVLDNNGTLLEAINFGVTTDYTVDGIPFDGWVPAASGAAYTGTNLSVTVTNSTNGTFSTSNNAISTLPVWASESYLTGATITIVINGIKPGREYRVQMMNCDARGSYAYNTANITLSDSSGASKEVDYNFGSTTDPYALMAIKVSSASSLTILMPTSAGKSAHMVGLVIHDITGAATNPVPINGQGLSLDVNNPLFEKVPVDQIMSWTAPSASDIDLTSLKYRVYMDPNQAKVQAGSGCQYFRDFDASVSYDPAGNLGYSTLFYWKVDTQLKYIGKTDPNTIPGNIWSFKTKALNNPAQIEAGQSIVTWLAKTQAGLVLDQVILAYPAEGDENITWSVIQSNYAGLPAPQVTIENNIVLNPKVFITATGVYRLKVVGKDSVNPDQTDMVEIIVYADACEAARNNPNTPYVALTYDFNKDCIEDVNDMSLFAAKWLEYNFAVNNIPFNPGTLTETDMLLWLDASEAASMVIDPNSSQVSRWNDKSGSGNYMVTAGSAGNPVLVVNSLNGKPIVDFGPAVASGSGKWMQLKSATAVDKDLTTIRTVFWVMKGGNFLLGDNNQYHFHRGTTEINADGLIWSNQYASANIRNGRTYLNGVNVNGTSTRLSATNYSLVSVVTTGNVEASRLCNDRNTIRSGGQQIAEIMVFNRPLSDPERLIIQQYLKGKWGTP